MPVPLIWLGAAVLGLYTANEANTAYLKRKMVIDAMPGESPHYTAPVNGSIVTCGVYGVLDHTGIWVNGNIYELAGSGLVRCVSPERFVGDRSGSQVYIACDTSNNALFDIDAAERAQYLLFSNIDYHLLSENCHKFVAEVLANQDVDITSFSDLNTFLNVFFSSSIRWNLSKINFR
ncbi:MAG: hypothetical protein ACJA0G_000322 [Kangiellaceae bacterium]|jgi:hypothetical protein